MLSPFNDPSSKVVCDQLKARQRQQRARYLLFFDDHAKGMPSRKIAEKHGCSHGTVLNGIFWCEQQAMPKLIHRVNRFKSGQTARFIHVQEEALQAWERSKEPAVTETSSTGGENGPSDTTKMEYQVGNPAYLNAVLKAGEKILEIWGAKATSNGIDPIRGENTSAPRPEEMAQMLESQAAILRSMHSLPPAPDVLIINHQNGSTNGSNGH